MMEKALQYTEAERKLEQGLLLKAVNINIDIPEYILAVLSDVSLSDIKELRKKRYWCDHTSDLTSNSETATKVSYLKLLSADICDKIQKKVLMETVIGRDVDIYLDDDMMKIKLYGGAVVESDVFDKCLSGLGDYKTLLFAFYRSLADISTNKHRICKTPVAVTLELLMGLAPHDNKSLDSVVEDLSLRFDKEITVNSITNQTITTLIIAHLLREIMLDNQPSTWVAMKVNETHIDYITSSKDNRSILFTGDLCEGTEYRHVYYFGIDKNGKPIDHRSVCVVSKGMFSIEKLSMILAQHYFLSNVVIVSWQELKDMAAYDAYHS